MRSNETVKHAVKTVSEKIIMVLLSIKWREIKKLLGESLSYSPGCEKTVNVYSGLKWGVGMSE